MGRSKSKLGRKNDPAKRDKPGNKSSAYNQKQFHKSKKVLAKLLQDVHESRAALSLQRNPKGQASPVNNDYGNLKVNRILRHSDIKSWKLKYLDLKSRVKNVKRN